MTRSSGPKNSFHIVHEIRPLTGIRAFAASGVLLTHFHTELESLVPAFSRLAPIYSRGGLGVDLFFILSGFIIAHIYAEKLRRAPGKEFVPYVINRFARIYPNYFVTLTMLVIMVFMGRTMGFTVQGLYSWEWLPSHYLMLQSFPGIPGGWNYPGWSIGAEFFAYLFVFPVFILFTKWTTPSPSIALSLVPLCLLAFWVPKLCGLWGMNEHLPMVSMEFLAGALLRHACLLKDSIRQAFIRFLPFTVLAILVILCIPPNLLGGFDRIALVLLFPPMLCGLWGSTGLIAMFLSSPAIVYLGHISYALYLVHAIVQKLFLATIFMPVMNAENSFWRIGAFVIYLVAPFLAASALYHVIEEPCRKWIRQHWRTDHPKIAG